MILISRGTYKLEGIDSINTNTPSNEFCQKMWKSTNDNVICKHCYSMYRLHCIRKSCQRVYQKNSDVLSNGIIPYQHLPKITQPTIRFNSHGELINENHMINLLNICETNPTTIFALWTKRINIVHDVLCHREKPENLILIYSNPIVDTIAKIPERFDKTFNVCRDSPEQNCGAKCKECMLCYEKCNGATVIIENLKLGIGQKTWERNNK